VTPGTEVDLRVMPRIEVDLKLMPRIEVNAATQLNGDSEKAETTVSK
jgi:hypothetical protein